MFREFRNLLIISLCIHPSIFLAIDQDPNQPDLETAQQEFAQAKNEIQIALEERKQAEARYLAALEVGRQKKANLQKHPGHLYGPDDEISRILGDDNNKADEEAGSNQANTWPLRIALGFFGAGTALVVSSYWMPDIPHTRGHMDCQSHEELYEGVKRKYRIIDDEDDI